MAARRAKSSGSGIVSQFCMEVAIRFLRKKAAAHEGFFLSPLWGYVTFQPLCHGLRRGLHSFAAIAAMVASPHEKQKGRLVATLEILLWLRFTEWIRSRIPRLPGEARGCIWSSCFGVANPPDQ